jgi:large subunit ribosomal protein L4
MKLAIQTWDNKSDGEITLDKAVFGLETRDDILNAMVKYQLAKRRAGTSKVKTRSCYG